MLPWFHEPMSTMPVTSPLLAKGRLRARGGKESASRSQREMVAELEAGTWAFYMLEGNVTLPPCSIYRIMKPHPFEQKMIVGLLECWSHISPLQHEDREGKIIIRSSKFYSLRWLNSYSQQRDLGVARIGVKAEFPWRLTSPWVRLRPPCSCLLGLSRTRERRRGRVGIVGK